jgi:cytochrome c-type biogenesis protein CcmH/NrfG
VTAKFRPDRNVMTEQASSTNPADSVKAFSGPTELGIARAAALFEQLDPEQAAGTLAAVLATDPGSVDGWLLMGRLRLALDDVPAALAAATTAIELAAAQPALA